MTGDELYRQIGSMMGPLVERLSNLEAKLDRVADALIALARMEERVRQHDDEMARIDAQHDEAIRRLWTAVDGIRADVDEMLAKVAARLDTLEDVNISRAGSIKTIERALWGAATLATTTAAIWGALH